MEHMRQGREKPSSVPGQKSAQQCLLHCPQAFKYLSAVIPGTTLDMGIIMLVLQILKLRPLRSYLQSPIATKCQNQQYLNPSEKLLLDAQLFQTLSYLQSFTSLRTSEKPIMTVVGMLELCLLYCFLFLLSVGSCAIGKSGICFTVSPP